MPLRHTSALCLLTKAQPDKLLQKLSRFKGRVIHPSLSPERKSAVQAALSGTQQPGLVAGSVALRPG